MFQDDKHVVELYDIGPNPHANEILVAYLPKEKILFQADLLNAAAEWKHSDCAGRDGQF